MTMKLKIAEICQETKFLTEDKIKEAVCKKAIRKYAYILHDKDTYTEDDEKNNPEHKAGTLKEPHWHICLQFRDSQNTKYVAKWFDIAEQYVNKSTSGHYEDMLLYLIHKNSCEKFQYNADEVHANFDYAKFIENNGTLKTRIQELTELIEDGTLREFNYHKYMTISEYQLYKADIQKAFEYRRDSLYNGNRHLEVIYINGGSGTGKTTLAKHIAEKHGYSIHISGGDNDLLDGYKGQDCIILDDLRGSSLKFSDFIKMIDNNTDSKVKSRYYNKCLTECKLIIITCIHDLDDFYSNLFSEQDEPLLQFKRRCKTLLVLNPYTVQSYSFNKGIDEYEFVAEFKNPVLDLIMQTVEETKDEKDMQEFLGLELLPHITSLNLKKGVILDGVPIPF